MVARCWMTKCSVSTSTCSFVS
ncbi:hypothetical protein EYF80_061903 [Liparis tanakae]|uniref:Uncharacterized protein n=1 Tax=Liparis tanakae TaxID=230148 RepID=A0A4Z2EGD0_9TELE|nr:hypothetical protein EYF80_061903 [Liparis tanakae]